VLPLTTLHTVTECRGDCVHPSLFPRFCKTDERMTFIRAVCAVRLHQQISVEFNFFLASAEHIVRRVQIELIFSKTVRSSNKW